MQSIEEKINLYRQYSSSDLLIHSDSQLISNKSLLNKRIEQIKRT
jgi:hypothetical protein